MMGTPPDRHRASWKLVRDDVTGHTLCIYAVHCKSSGHLAAQLVLYGIMRVNVLLQERLTSHSSGLLLHDIHGSSFLSVLLTSCFEGLSVPTPLARSPPIFGTAGPQRLHLVMVWFAFLFFYGLSALAWPDSLFSHWRRLWLLWVQFSSSFERGSRSSQLDTHFSTLTPLQPWRSAGKR